MTMLRTGTAIALALTLAPPGLQAQTRFEGKVAFSMEITSQLGPMSAEVEHFVKDDMVRQVIKGLPMGEMITLMKMGSGSMTVMSPAMKMYRTIEIGDMTQSVAGQEVPAIERTGQKERIAGHECELVTVTMRQGTVEMCVASDLGHYFMGGMDGGLGAAGPTAGLIPAMEAAILEAFEEGFFPLKVNANMGGQTISIVATAVQETSLSDDIFEIPADYSRMSGPGGT